MDNDYEKKARQIIASSLDECDPTTSYWSFRYVIVDTMAETAQRFLNQGKNPIDVLSESRDTMKIMIPVFDEEFDKRRGSDAGS